MKKRILSLALALIMAVSMAIPAFAAEPVNKPYTLETAPHYSDGKLLERVNPPKSSQFPDIVYGDWKANKEDTKVLYTVNLKVGEKITVHIPHPYMELGDGRGQDYYKVWVTSLDFFDASMYNGDKELTDLKLSDMKLHNINGRKLPCTELYITGTKNGTAEMIFTIEPFAPQLIRIVVGSGTPQEQKPTAEKSYKFNDIPKSWIKEVKKDNVVIGYTVTVPNNKTASFAISGTQFESVKAKDKDGKSGDTVKLTRGKQKTIKNVTALSLTLRKTGK